MATRESKQQFLRAMESAHGVRLHRFLASRVRESLFEVPDMIQEVYLRLLRVEAPESIANPEAYVLTIAKHVLYEHRTRRASVVGAVDVHDYENWLTTDPSKNPEAQALSSERLASVQATLLGLSPKARAVLLMHRIEGVTLEEIGKRLGISRSMAKKYLASALARCRARSTQD